MKHNYDKKISLNLILNVKKYRNALIIFVTRIALFNYKTPNPKRDLPL